MVDAARRMAVFNEQLERGAGDMARRAAAAHPAAAQPTAVHRQVVQLLEDILNMGTQVRGDGSQGHTALLIALRTVRKLQPVALEELARVPEAEVRGFLGGLATKISRAVGGMVLVSAEDLADVLEYADIEVGIADSGFLNASMRLREAVGLAPRGGDGDPADAPARPAEPAGA